LKVIKENSKKLHCPIMSINSDKKQYGYVSKAVAFFPNIKPWEHCCTVGHV
jgi:hypothetical protein